MLNDKIISIAFKTSAFATYVGAVLTASAPEGDAMLALSVISICLSAAAGLYENEKAGIFARCMVVFSVVPALAAVAHLFTGEPVVPFVVVFAAALVAACAFCRCRSGIDFNKEWSLHR